MLVRQYRILIKGEEESTSRQMCLAKQKKWLAAAAITHKILRGRGGRHRPGDLIHLVVPDVDLLLHVVLVRLDDADALVVLLAQGADVGFMVSKRCVLLLLEKNQLSSS